MTGSAVVVVGFAVGGGFGLFVVGGGAVVGIDIREPTASPVGSMIVRGRNTMANTVASNAIATTAATRFGVVFSTWFQIRSPKALTERRIRLVNLSGPLSSGISSSATVRKLYADVPTHPGGHSQKRPAPARSRTLATRRWPVTRLSSCQLRLCQVGFVKHQLD